MQAFQHLEDTGEIPEFLNGDDALHRYDFENNSTLAMLATEYGNVVPDNSRWCHDSTQQNDRGETVAIIMARCDHIVPRNSNWYHNPSLRDNDGQTVQDILGDECPEWWKLSYTIQFEETNVDVDLDPGMYLLRYKKAPVFTDGDNPAKRYGRFNDTIAMLAAKYGIVVPKESPWYHDKTLRNHDNKTVGDLLCSRCPVWWKKQ